MGQGRRLVQGRAKRARIDIQETLIRNPLGHVTGLFS
jgi:hypothetical protein